MLNIKEKLASIPPYKLMIISCIITIIVLGIPLFIFVYSI